jgi:hypothetical protein
MGLDALTRSPKDASTASAGPIAATVSQLTADGPLVAPIQGDEDGGYGPCRGSLTVAAGDTVLVTFDDAGTPWIIAKS